MNRFHETNADSLRRLALQLHPQGRRRLRMNPLRLHRLQRCLDAVARLRDRICADLQELRGERGVRLAACGGGVRILALARALVSGGEHAPDIQHMLEAIHAFDAVQEMQMLEIQCIPLALRSAIC